MQNPYYRRGKCPVCGKTAERQLWLHPEEYEIWMRSPVRHKRCEGFCEHCKKRVVSLGTLLSDPWAGCNGVRELRIDPFSAEVQEDYTEVMLCHGQWQTRKDDI